MTSATRLAVQPATAPSPAHQSDVRAPTGSPRPYSGTRPNPARAGVSSPSRRSAETSTGGRARAAPSSILSATAPTCGTASAKTPSAPHLRQQSRHRAHQPGVLTSGAADQLRMGPHRVGDRPLRRARVRLDQPEEGPGQGGQRDRQHRGATAVHPDRGGRLAGQLLDGGAQPLLQRVRRRPVVLDRPAGGLAGQQHAGVLARAVHRQPRGGAAGAQQRRAGVLAERQVGRAAEVGLGRTRRSRAARGPGSAWAGSPKWLAATSARSAGSLSRSPARSIPTACIGLFDERGKIGAVTSPAAATGAPVASSTTTEPRCSPSAKPERTTSASGTPPEYVIPTR